MDLASQRNRIEETIIINWNRKYLDNNLPFTVSDTELIQNTIEFNLKFF